MAVSPMSIFQSILSRKSIRAFTDQPVSLETIKEILKFAARAPSGTNIQPWQVIVLTGSVLQKVGQELSQLVLSGVKGEREYQYYPRQWREPYLSRRRKVGLDLYQSLGIQKGDEEKMLHQKARNFLFFDAPVGFLFTMDHDMEMGSWLDLGMFMQTIMLAARGFGLDTCPQAAFADYHKQIRILLSIPSDRHIICGMALGYRDMNAPENNFKTEREPLENFVRFIETYP
ncbi:nitroreductase [Bartonella tribocorum]|uniref:Nitroreductase family protein n=1 Tax=Bartonella tribocorum (strain DSM 28219 / CCUG 45778 / CIP 105476 / IBS 506) TaxID=382640 RepID=A9ISH2_BART1|nr:nitroreductase [Bartonella tribocorum]CAK01301.1 nitroreductase family protein [Bartonella tribocorum CIP 105476]CDO48524.1 nitroreductase [Bartonella tribocorum]